MSAHIMVFDSGIGGTTVLEQIQTVLPNANYSYFMDNALLPYGAQCQATIVKRLLALLNYINHNQLAVDILVIACNTASTSALDIIRQYTQLPIVGVVPAIKPASQKTMSKHIGLLATPATIHSDYTKHLIDAYARNIKVHLYASTELVAIAEHYFFNNYLCKQRLYKALDSLSIVEDIDVLVLGCTHFPLLSTAINEYLPHSVMLIDSGFAIAKRVKERLILSTPHFSEDKKKPLHYYATAFITSNKFNMEFVTLIDLTLYENR
ncbi:glutamate racemase [Pseudoalteromonas mariniglutinosa]|uniref:glutamate racemase n=1 Tax=Pseudoalteromonas mariniglutinosa TaxID=206042 RepID=UPI003850E8C0